MYYIYLVIGLTVLFLALTFLVFYIDNHTLLDVDVLKGIVACCFIISFIVLVISLIVFGFSNANVEAANEGYRETYNSLVYQLENHIYDDDLVGKKELYNQIERYNANYAYIKKANKNPWIGAFYPDTYAGLEKIELEDIK